MAQELAQKDTLDTQIGKNYESLQTTYTSFKDGLKAFVQSGGISQGDSDPNFSKANDAWTSLRTSLKSYQQFNSQLSKQLQDETNASDITNSLQEYDRKKNILDSLNTKLEERVSDLDIAKSRQESIPRAHLDQSFQQGISGRLGFLRPLKPISVAMLLGLGIFLFFVSVLILRDFFSFGDYSVWITENSMESSPEFMGGSSFRWILMGITLTFLLFAGGLYIYFYKLHY
jgi:hypothetical protein